MESIWNAQTGALAVERMCWSAVEIACSWKPCSGTHTFERSQWNHIETEALPMNVNHHQVEDLALQNLGNSWNACNGTHVLQHMLYVCIYIYTYRHTYIHTYVYVYIYIYIYTNVSSCCFPATMHSTSSCTSNSVSIHGVARRVETEPLHGFTEP